VLAFDYSLDQVVLVSGWARARTRRRGQIWSNFS
jgi:hypothetical protein